MVVFDSYNNCDFNEFIVDVKEVISSLEGYAKDDEIRNLNKFLKDFQLKTQDFYRENRKLNIGIIGQVKAGKSSFLNT